jgi:hypothetical protein
MAVTGDKISDKVSNPEELLEFFSLTTCPMKPLQKYEFMETAQIHPCRWYMMLI